MFHRVQISHRQKILPAVILSVRQPSKGRADVWISLRGDVVSKLDWANGTMLDLFLDPKAKLALLSEAQDPDDASRMLRSIAGKGTRFAVSWPLAVFEAAGYVRGERREAAIVEVREHGIVFKLT